MLLALPAAFTFTPLFTWIGAIHDDTHTRWSWLLLLHLKTFSWTDKMRHNNKYILLCLFHHFLCHPRCSSYLLPTLYTIHTCNTHLFCICLAMWEQVIRFYFSSWIICFWQHDPLLPSTMTSHNTHKHTKKRTTPQLLSRRAQTQPSPVPLSSLDNVKRYNITF